MLRKAITATLAAIAALALMPAAAAGEPDVRWLTFPTSVAPGSTIVQLDRAARMFRQQCTLGAYARDRRSGAMYAVTAGHCAPRGESFPVVYGTTSRPDVARVLGYFSAAKAPEYSYQDRGLFPDKTDVGLIRVNDATTGTSRPSVSTKIADKLTITGLANMEYVVPGVELCKYGQTSKLTCGPIQSVGTEQYGGNQIVANLSSLSGDSGSLGFIRTGPTTAVAVGILNGSPVGNDNQTVFYPLAPVLGAFELDLA